MSIYPAFSAYAPRENCDRLFMNPATKTVLSGRIADTLKFISEFQLISPDMWKRFVRQFSEHTDSHDEGWRGEYWGKMMRGATFVYEVTRDPALFDVLKETVEDMISTADENGRISSYTLDAELTGWDLWCRKYVILGMQYFTEISDDKELNSRILACMEGQLKALMTVVGPRSEGKTPVTYTSNFWRGLNASSILEPVVRAYSLTGNEIYLGFAEHIIGEGFTQVDNLIDLAYKNDAAPYQYPITKAYEMISCFMGLLEYYRIKGIEKHRTAVVNFASKVLETDFTVAGSGGMAHELFDHSLVRQANPNKDSTAQETCVTVTMMQMFSQLALFTGETKYLDAFERSLYNAYLGSVNTEKCISPYSVNNAPLATQEPLPFDSYSPLTAATRGTCIGGFKVMPDNRYYGCCACIGSAGIGLAGKMALLSSREGIALALYIPGNYETILPSGSELSLTVDTNYPAGGLVRIYISPEKTEEFTLSLRIPSWCEKAELTVSGRSFPVTHTGMTDIRRVWKKGDEILLSFDMPIKIHRPIPYGRDLLMNKYCGHVHIMAPNLDIEDPEAKRHAAFTKGPLVLAADEALGADFNSPIPIDLSQCAENYFPATSPFDCQLVLSLPLSNGGTVTLADYASVGKTWKTKIAAWIKCE